MVGLVISEFRILFLYHQVFKMETLPLKKLQIDLVSY